MNNQSNTALLDWLPEVYRDTSMTALLNLVNEIFTDLHTRIDEIPDTFKPKSSFFEPLIIEDGASTKQREYLEWFSSWVNLIVGEDWEHTKKQDILAKILPLYKKRGTREGLNEYLRIYAGEGIKSLAIEDDLPSMQVGDLGSAQLGINMIIGGFPPATQPMQVGKISSLGVNSIIGGFPPYFFTIDAEVMNSGPAAVRETRNAIINILEMEKPAHTWYRLTVIGPTFQLNNQDTAVLGVNTII